MSHPDVSAQQETLKRIKELLKGRSCSFGSNRWQYELFDEVQKVVSGISETGASQSSRLSRTVVQETYDTLA